MTSVFSEDWYQCRRWSVYMGSKQRPKTFNFQTSAVKVRHFLALYCWQDIVPSLFYGRTLSKMICRELHRVSFEKKSCVYVTIWARYSTNTEGDIYPGPPVTFYLWQESIVSFPVWIEPNRFGIQVFQKNPYRIPIKIKIFLFFSVYDINI